MHLLVWRVSRQQSASSAAVLDPVPRCLALSKDFTSFLTLLFLYPLYCFCKAKLESALPVNTLYNCWILLSSSIVVVSIIYIIYFKEIFPSQSMDTSDILYFKQSYLLIFKYINVYTFLDHISNYIFQTNKYKVIKHRILYMNISKFS